ncbi:MAG TPA: FHA domain-containing protein [Anaerolineales bacterium]|nr:FHA domain-containing protein [Anaerolineales bacterium]
MQSKGSYRLVAQLGPMPGKVYELTKEVSTIGRDLRSDIAVNDAEVSRTHARLAAQADGYLVEDLMSTNGTYVNGQRLTAPKLLRPGDILGLGETVTLQFELVPEPGAAPTVAQSSPAPAMFSMPTPDYPPSGQAMPAPPPISEGAPEPEPKKRGPMFWLAVGCGCLTALACLAGAIALGVYLWNAPPEFWQSIGLG